MSEWAKIDADSIVVQVFIADTLDGLTEEGFTYQPSTPTNTAAIGGKYWADTNEYSPPAPYPSWSFNEELRVWEAPVPKPSNEKYLYETPAGFIFETELWQWSESTLTWVEFPNPID